MISSKATIPVLLTIALFALACIPASAISTYWDVSSGSWHTAGNWDNGIPNINDDAHINNGGTAEISTAVSIRQILVGGSTESSLTQISSTTTFSQYLFIGLYSAQSGIYNLTDGTLNSTGATVYVGRGGTGTFNQNGGTHNINPNAYNSYGEMYLGYSSSGAGTYNLSDGLLDVYSLEVGRDGTGAFNHNGGTHAVNSMVIAGSAGSIGTYDFISGTINAQNIVVSSRGNATFTHTRGQNNVTTLIVGNQYQANAGGTYDLHAPMGSAGEQAELFATTEYIGYNGIGAFSHIRGYNTVDNLYVGYNSGSDGQYRFVLGENTVTNLHIGYNSGSNGEYIFSGGVLSTNSINIGHMGTGIFTQDNLFSTYTWSQMSLANSSGAHGTYNLSDGGMMSDGKTLYLGRLGTGVFNHTGGTNTLNADSYGSRGEIVLGYDSGANGTYNLSGTGYLNANEITLGYNGTGDFNQSGGTHVVEYLVVGGNAGSTGTYHMTGGTLNAENLTVSSRGHGTFTHSAGTINATDLILGNQQQASTTGEYNLSGSGQLSVSVERIGYNGTGVFNQNGGTNTISDGTLYLGYNTTGDGTYNFSGGTLNVDDIVVGHNGTGTFTHNAGTISVTNLIIAGQNQASLTGTYNLSGSANISTTTTIYAGRDGIGLFNQTGSTNTAATLYIGHNAGSNGEYALSGGTISVNSIIIGYAGTGVLTQSGSTINQWTQILMGVSSGAHGTYNLSGGTMESDGKTLYLGRLGTGVFNHTGGTNTLNPGSYGSYGEIVLGYDSDANGTYNLSGTGDLNANEITVGREGTGDFNQSGGTHTVNYLTVGGNAGSTGSYNLTDGTLNAENLTVSSRGHGTFTHSAGTSTLVTLTVGNQQQASTTGEYNLSGSGQLSVSVERIGYNGTGVFNQSGGTNTISGTLYLGYNATGDGTYNLNDGTLNTGNLVVGHSGAGRLVVNGGDLNVGGDFAVDSFFDITYNLSSITVGGDLTFEDGAVFSAVAGSTVHMTGSNFYNESTSASDMAGLGNTEFIFEGGAGVLDTFEVAGLIDGGFTDNFAIGNLTMGGTDEGHLQLVDNTDNGNRGTEGEECLFVTDITINSGSSLDVNGFLLYESGDQADEWNTWIADGWLLDGTEESLNAFYDSENDWTTFGGATVPEPGTIILIGAAMAGLAGIIRRKMIK